MLTLNLIETFEDLHLIESSDENLKKTLRDLTGKTHNNKAWFVFHKVQWLSLNPLPVKLVYVNFHPLEVVSRYSDPQLQMGKNSAYLFKVTQYDDIIFLF